MIGGDVVIAFFNEQTNKYEVVDYDMTSRSQVFNSFQ